MYKEQKIASFQQGKDKLQLLKLTEVLEIPGDCEEPDYVDVRYQVRLNRKRIDTSLSEYTMRKLFAMYVQNIILQLKIY